MREPRVLPRDLLTGNVSKRPKTNLLIAHTQHERKRI